MRNSLFWLITAGALHIAGAADAEPSGGVVTDGGATIAKTGKTTTISQTTDKVIIEWTGFNVDANERVAFNQPTKDAIALNRILGNGPSLINGQIDANGRVFIINGDGVVFGSTAKVDVNGLVATSIDIADAAFMAGDFTFDQPGSISASIVNEGSINAADAGMVAFVAPTVRNSGLIAARFGKIALGAGEVFTLDFFGDSLIAFASTNTAGSKSGAVLVDGVIDAEAGIILLAATAARDFVDTIINVEADLVARSATRQGGKIILAGGDQSVITIDAALDAVGTSGGAIDIQGGEINVTANAELLTDAKTGLADGGDINVHSATRTEFAGAASSAPGASGGVGGDITISSDGVLVFTGSAFAGDPPRNGVISLNSAGGSGGGTGGNPGGGGSPGGNPGGGTGGNPGGGPGGPPIIVPGPNLSDAAANRLTEIFGTAAILATTTPGVPASDAADYRLTVRNGGAFGSSQDDGAAASGDASSLFCLYDLSETACAK